MVAQAIPPPRRYTAQEYLELEYEAQFKSELLCGQIYAMAGGTIDHSQITVNLSVEVGGQLRGRPCRALSSDMKVMTGPDGLFAYPDLSAVCAEPQFFDRKRHVLTNPTTIFEVLSPSTEAYDRGTKFQMYQEIESLRDYVLVSQDQPRVEVFSRNNDKWILSTAFGLEASIVIPSLGITIPLANVYDRIVLPPRITSGLVGPEPERIRDEREREAANGG